MAHYKQYKFKKLAYWTVRNSLKSILHSDRRKRLRELKSTISTGKLFHIFTTRQAKNDIWYLSGSPKLESLRRSIGWSRRHNRLSACRLRWPTTSLSFAVPAISGCASCEVLFSRWRQRRRILWFNYCNALLYGIADPQLQRLQSVQNTAARLVTGTRRTNHIMPVLQSLHGLPVRQSVTFKLATLVHKCLDGRAPGYTTTT